MKIEMPERKFKPFVIERFKLNKEVCDELYDTPYEFGYDGFGEAVFYRTYSRVKEDKQNENWPDVVIRVTNGVYSIVKDYYVKNHLRWDETYWQKHAKNLSHRMFNMEWLPPGRGLFSMGTDYMYNRGSLCLFNCAFVKIEADKFSSQCNWIMDLLMNGVGVGFEVEKSDIKLYEPKGMGPLEVVIDDSREGWSESVEILLESYTSSSFAKIKFDYSKIRPKGLPIKGYGGLSSGPEPLMWLHDKIRGFCNNRICDPHYSSIQLFADIVNCIGCCVISGNVRRSAQICIGDINDKDFMNLKNYKNPNFEYRKEFGWMSNNTVKLSTHS